MSLLHLGGDLLQSYYLYIPAHLCERHYLNVIHGASRARHTHRKKLLIVGHGVSLQNVYYTSTQRLHVGLLSPTVDDDDNKCLVDVNGRPRLIECSYAAAKRMKLHWLFTQVTTDNDTRVQRAELSVSSLYSASTEGALLNVQLVIHQGCW